MRIVFPHAKSALRVILGMGLIGLLFAPLIYAQEYPADLTRGKAVYQRNCQACHGVGGGGMDRTRKTSRWRRQTSTALCPF
ncbi:MAG: cytochrome c [Nitrospirae bacterium]|nr:cytochrome c [Nitrospirota bacterium]